MGDFPVMSFEKVASLIAAAICVMAAVSNKVFYFGKMGGGETGKRMPTWLVRLIVFAVAGMFVWFVFERPM
jgi:hypothetical protein